jgi:hypothetical protein
MDILTTDLRAGQRVAIDILGHYITCHVGQLDTDALHPSLTLLVLFFPVPLYRFKKRSLLVGFFFVYALIYKNTNIYIYCTAYIHHASNALFIICKMKDNT